MHKFTKCHKKNYTDTKSPQINNNITQFKALAVVYKIKKNQSQKSSKTSKINQSIVQSNLNVLH